MSILILNTVLEHMPLVDPINLLKIIIMSVFFSCSYSI